MDVTAMVVATQFATSVDGYHRVPQGASRRRRSILWLGADLREIGPH